MIRHSSAGARCATALAVAALTAAPAAAPAQGRAESGAFVVRLGADTIAAERFTRTGNRIEGELMNVAPMVRVARYVITLDAQGRMTNIEWQTKRPDGSPMPNAPLGVKMQLANDTATAVLQFADSTSTRRGPAPAGAVVSLGNSYFMYELGLRPLRAARVDSGAFVLTAPGAPSPQSMSVKFAGDVATMNYFGDPMKLKLDRDGRILSVDGSQTTSKVVVTRVKNLDVNALARTLAARPQMGQTSPRDTARATVGAAQLLVDYSRPSMRKRTVWGGTLVPYGAIWRTGANAATQLRTSADLVIGGTTVPAGTYTLWTLPSAQGYQLVVNKQTGQWGTEYDEKQDLVRVPLKAERVASPVEQFTIALEPAGATGGTLAMTWDTQRLTVPFTVK
jgi:hypothetical protein